METANTPRPDKKEITPELLERLWTAHHNGYIHIINLYNKLKVIKYGASCAIGTYNDQATALSVARKSIGAAPGLQIVIHGLGGEVLQVITP